MKDARLFAGTQIEKMMSDEDAKRLFARTQIAKMMSDEDAKRLSAALNELTSEAHDNAVDHGFWADYADIHILVGPDEELTECAEDMKLVATLGLIASEVGEAVSAVQHGDREGLYSELADIVIRTLDLGGYLKIDFGDEVVKKMRFNRTRLYKHGKRC